VAAESELQFDGWTVNRVSGEISRDGRNARLPQQPLRILIELFDHAGAVVTREQLVRVLWPAGVVDFDNGLNVAVRKLRVALDDVGDVPRYIETLPRVGYRFIGARSPRGAPVAHLPRVRKGSRIVLVLSLAAVGITIALGWWLAAKPGAAPQAHHVPSERARELYLEALSLRSRRDIDTSTLTRDKLEAALREDPDYSQAWAALADSLSASVIRQGLTPADGVPRARAAAERAIALDDGLAEGHYSLGVVLMEHYKDFAGAGREYARAMALNDKAARLWHHYGMWRGELGHVDEALAALRRAREIEPMTLLYANSYAMLLYEARRYDEAIAFLKPYVEANPKFDQARGALARPMIAVGNLSGALEQLTARTQIGLSQGELGVVYAKLGRREDALGEIARLEQRARDGYGVAYDEALIYTALDDLDHGCELLTRAVTDHSVMVNWMRLDPLLDPLRGRQCYTDAERKLYGSS